MPDLRTLETVLWAAVTALTAVLAAKLFYSRLASSYRLFTAFLVYSVFRSAIIPFLKLSKTGYGYFFVFSESITITFYLLTVLEAYALVFQDYRHLRRSSAWLVFGSLILATTTSAAWFLLGAEPANRLGVLGAFLIVERGALFALTLLILLITTFLAWFPITLPRNVIVHTFTFAAFFLSKALTSLYRHITHQNVRAEVSIIIFCLASLCLTTWIIFLNRQGEARIASSAFPRDPREQAILLSKIDALNTTMEKIARK